MASMATKSATWSPSSRGTWWSSAGSSSRFPTDYYLPQTAIGSYDNGELFLTVTKDEALNQGWDVEPEVVPVVETTTTDMAATWPEPAPASVTATAEDELVVPVHEEELTATTTRHEVGGARVEKTVEAVEQTLAVPVTEERLQVVRRVVDRLVDAADAEAFEEVIVDVPLTRDEVEVEKRTRVAEEVAIRKEAVQRTEQASGTVCRKHVTVTEADPGAVVEGDEPPR
jgi:uncharacterized protein (TIGR02271 family)